MVERKTFKNKEIFDTTKNWALWNSSLRPDKKNSELGHPLIKKAGPAPEVYLVNTVASNFENALL